MGNKKPNVDFKSISIKQGKFELCGNTVVEGHEIYSTGLEICEWDNNRTFKWTIASFKYSKKESCYKLKSCCDRLRGIKDWNDFGILVNKAYEILES